MPRGPKHKVKKISAKQAHMLRVGNRVIQTVRSLLKYGSGNQTPESNRKAHIRTSVTYDFLENNPKHDWRPRRIHQVVARTGAGNCDQLGAMAYALCRDYLGPEYFASWVSVPGHSFAVIGEYPPKKKKFWVAVDPWPHKAPKATLFPDHWCFSDPLEIIVQPNKGRGRGRGVYQPTKAMDEVNEALTKQWSNLFNTNQTAVFPNYDVQNPWENDEEVTYELDNKQN